MDTPKLTVRLEKTDRMWRAAFDEAQVLTFLITSMARYVQHQGRCAEGLTESCTCGLDSVLSLLQEKGLL
jgi:hypothetical protein